MWGVKLLVILRSSFNCCASPPSSQGTLILILSDKFEDAKDHGRKKGSSSGVIPSSELIPIAEPIVCGQRPFVPLVQYIPRSLIGIM